MPAEAAGALPVKADRALSHAALDAAHRFLSTFIRSGPILVAVSGGSDSKGLLLALHAALSCGRYAGLSLCACTVDHALRPCSAGEAAAVEALCRSLDIAHVTMTWRGEKPSSGLQAAARMARYALLAEAARHMSAICMVTGHSADDQDETISMRSQRSQPEAHGLSGMAPAMLFGRRTWVLRPFLALRRAEIRDYLRSLGEDWIEDPSNVNRRFERVRVRFDIEDRAIVSASNAVESRRQSGRRVAGFLERHVSVFGQMVGRVDPVPAAAVVDPDARRAILTLAAVIGGRSHTLGKDAADRVVAFVEGAADGRLTAGRVVFDRRRSGLYLYRETRDLPQIKLLPGQQRVWDGRFCVSNEGESEIVAASLKGNDDACTASIAALTEAGLPDAIAKRAAPAGLSVLALLAGRPGTVVCVEPHIALYDTFLPCFDRIMTDAIATLFGRDPYSTPPVHDI